jgi:hypothetical protein
MASYLAEARYGKAKVRVFRIVREGETHHIVEYNVQVLLEGDMETRQASFPFSFQEAVFEGGGQLYASGQQRRRRDRFHKEHHLL